MKFNATCSYCNKQVYRRPDRLKQNKNTYCNLECKHNHLKEKRTIVKCENCNKELSLTPKRSRNSKTGIYFCNNNCKNPYIAANKRWAKNPNCYQKRRPVILNVANKACQNCGYNADERMLDIHHHDNNHKNNDWDNLRCVCSWCHTLHHRGVQILKLPPLNLEMII